MIKGAHLNPGDTHKYEGKTFYLSETIRLNTASDQLVTIKTYIYNGRCIMFVEGFAVNFHIGASIGTVKLRTYTWSETRIIINHITRSKMIW